MSWKDTLRTALAAIGSHRLRSILTMLGILIGIAAVILTVGLGQGAQAQVRDQISKLGSNLLIVSPGSATSSTGIRGGRGSASTLTARDASALATHSVAPDVARVAPVASSSQSLTAGTTNWTTTVAGTTPDWLSVRARTVSEGRFFTAPELTNAAQVTVLGPDTATELFGGRSPIGQTVTAGNATLTVIGVLTSAGSSTATNDDDQAIVPMTTAATRIGSGTTRAAISTIYLEATSQDTLTAAYQEANAALLSLHGDTAATADFTIASQQSLLDTATSTDRTLTILLGGVAALSLLVGGIGVMNIMLVSVTERIREIGLRKALGATPAVIRHQFLTEAGLLGFTGGLLGLGLGLAGAATLPGVLNQPVTVSPLAAAAAVTVALAIGIGAGVYPASRAARLAPIDALRSE
ncbi:MAG: putative transport system permease protein [Cryptosporangiaceae bacterium]|nr:putative transport system permease protein [Cryptosporangiaceae bacterium]